jgi:hypothetical protein
MTALPCIAIHVGRRKGADGFFGIPLEPLPQLKVTIAGYHFTAAPRSRLGGLRSGRRGRSACSPQPHQLPIAFTLGGTRRRAALGPAFDVYSTTVPGKWSNRNWKMATWIFASGAHPEFSPNHIFIAAARPNRANLSSLMSFEESPHYVSRVDVVGSGAVNAHCALRGRPAVPHSLYDIVLNILT